MIVKKNVENRFKYTAQMPERYVGMNAVKIKHYVVKLLHFDLIV